MRNDGYDNESSAFFHEHFMLIYKHNKYFYGNNKVNSISFSGVSVLHFKCETLLNC